MHFATEKLKIFLTDLRLFLLVAAFVSGCGGGGGSNGYGGDGTAGPDAGNGWLSISAPTSASSSVTDKDSVELGGQAFYNISFEDDPCNKLGGIALLFARFSVFNGPAYTLTVTNDATGSTISNVFMTRGCISAGLSWNTGVALNIGENIVRVEAKDANGNAGQDHILIVRERDTTPPTVVSVVPRDKSTGASVRAKPEIAFSEDINVATISNSTITLKDGSGNLVPSSIDYYSERATISPDASLAYNTQYEITVTAGVQDKAGNPLPSPYVTSFTTGASPDTTPPNVESVSPLAGSDCAAVSGGVSATFNEELYPLSVNDTTFLLKDSLGQPIPGAVSYSNRVASFTPSGSLPADSSFTATLTAGVEDLSRNAMSANFEWGFTTVSPAGVGSWTPTELTGAPFRRSDHVAVWTGSEMIIAGGLAWDTDWRQFDYTRQYGRFNPATNSWTLSSGAPRGLFRSSIWTGTEMIVWGGYQAGVPLGDGARYNPSTDNWQTVQSAGAPSARRNHTAVWTGTEMIVWGGRSDYSTEFGDGARYNPSTDSWQPVQSAGAPSARYGHTAVWTGTEMIVWGGFDDNGVFRNDGARYNPQSDTWSPVTLVDAPSKRLEHVAVWTGSEMIVWGGTHLGSVNSGGRYNPASDTWRSTNETCAPTGHWNARAVWAGSRMIILGGENTSGPGAGIGYEYDPVIDNWQMVTAQNAPDPRASHTVVWTGSKVIIWGGSDGGPLGDGGIFTP